MANDLPDAADLGRRAITIGLAAGRFDWDQVRSLILEDDRDPRYLALVLAHLLGVTLAQAADATEQPIDEVLTDWEKLAETGIAAIDSDE